MEIIGGLLAGAFIGAVLGFIGAGGAMLSVPILLYIFDFTPQAATTAAIAVVLSAAISGLLPKIKSKEVLFREAAIIWALGLITNLGFSVIAHRLSDSLKDAVNVFGADRLGAICREMTKRYEETIRGNLGELSEWADANEILGEITLVIAGAVTDSASLTAADMVGRVREFEAAGMDRKSAIATVADEFGIAKRLVYAAVVDANKMSQ
ncbi:MAG: hypothetical protein EBW25_05740 [Actinobacteria bacterium]|nr:hypothetical protein [Actinomycetota bacterium]